jgi:hypothetical protein
MRFAVLLAFMAGCAESRPEPVTPMAKAPPPPVVEEVAIAKAPVIRLEKTSVLVFPTTEHALSPHAAVSYADVACRSEAGKTTCKTRTRDDKHEQQDLEFRARLEQCFRVSPGPKGSAMITSIATDARTKENVTVPVIDCPGPPCPATRTILTDVDQHTFTASIGSETFTGAFAMTSAPAVFAVIEGDFRFTNRVSDPREVLTLMESMKLDKEGDTTQLANLVDRAVLAFQIHDEKKGAAYAKDLDAWLAAHPSVERSADLEAARATFASIAKGTLRTTDPCTDQGAPSRPLTQAPPLAK